LTHYYKIFKNVMLNLYNAKKIRIIYLHICTTGMELEKNKNSKRKNKKAILLSTFCALSPKLWKTIPNSNATITCVMNLSFVMFCKINKRNFIFLLQTDLLTSFLKISCSQYLAWCKSEPLKIIFFVVAMSTSLVLYCS